MGVERLSSSRENTNPDSSKESLKRLRDEIKQKEEENKILEFNTIKDALDNLPEDKSERAFILGVILSGLNRFGLRLNNLNKDEIEFIAGRQSLKRDLNIINRTDVGRYNTLFDSYLSSGKITVDDINRALLYRTNSIDEYIDDVGVENTSVSSYVKSLLRKYHINISVENLDDFTEFSSEDDYNRTKNTIINFVTDSQADKDFLYSYFTYIYLNKKKPFNENEIKDGYKPTSDRIEEGILNELEGLTDSQKFALGIKSEESHINLERNLKHHFGYAIIDNLYRSIGLSGFLAIVGGIFKGKKGIIGGFLLGMGAIDGVDLYKIGQENRRGERSESGSANETSAGTSSASESSPEGTRNIENNISGIINFNSVSDLEKRNELERLWLELSQNEEFLNADSSILNIFNTETDETKIKEELEKLGIELTEENKEFYKQIFSEILRKRRSEIGNPVEGESIKDYLERSDEIEENEVEYPLFSNTYNFQIIDEQIFLIGENGQILSQINNLTPEAKEILEQYEKVGILYEVLKIWLPHAEKISQSLLLPGIRSGTTIIPNAIEKINSNFENLFEKLQKGESYTTELNNIWREINRAESSKSIIGTSDMRTVKAIFESNKPKEQKLIEIYNTMRYGGLSGNSEGVKNQVAEHLLRQENFKDINDILENPNTYELIKNHNRNALEQILGKDLTNEILNAYSKIRRKQERLRENYSEVLVDINIQRKEAGEEEISLNDYIELNIDFTIEELLKHSLLKNKISEFDNRGNQNESFVGLYANISGLAETKGRVRDLFKISDNNIDVAIDIGATLALATVSMGVGAIAARGALAAATWGAKATRITALSHKAGKAGGVARWAGASTVEGYAFYQGYNTMSNAIYGNDLLENSTNSKEILKTVAFMGVLRGISGVMKNAEAAHLAKNNPVFRGFNNPKTGETLAFIGKMTDKVPAGILRNTGEILIKGGLVTGTSVGIEYIFEGEAEWTWEEYLQAVIMVGAMKGAGKINFSRKNGKVEVKVQAPKEQVGFFKSNLDKVNSLPLPKIIKDNLGKTIIDLLKAGGVGGTFWASGMGALDVYTGGNFTDNFLRRFMEGFVAGASIKLVFVGVGGVKKIFSIGKDGALKNSNILPKDWGKIALWTPVALGGYSVYSAISKD